MSFKEYASKEFVDEIYLRKDKANTVIHDFINLRDTATGCTYYAYIENGIWITSCKVVKIQVTNLPDKTSYIEGELFDTTGMAVSATLENGNTVVIDDFIIKSASVRSNNVEIAFIDKFSNEEIITNIEVEVTEFDPTIYLIDFEYTTNDDGTYTITGWKQTLNGEPSTELIIPDNSLIVI